MEDFLLRLLEVSGLASLATWVENSFGPLGLIVFTFALMGVGAFALMKALQLINWVLRKIND